jgi:hypothetical protein
VILVELLGLVYASFLFMRIILLFIFTCRNLLVKSPLYMDVSEKPMMEIIYLFSVGTLTFVRTIETFVEMFCHRFFLLVRTIRASCIIKSPIP